MEKISLTPALGNQILSRWNLPVYWTLYFGRQDLIEMFKQEQVEFDEAWFQKIHPIQRDEHTNILQEHFIIRHLSEGQYIIEDRNNPSLTYLNNIPVTKNPVPIHHGDVIALPISRYGRDEALFIQFGIRPNDVNASEQQFGQLFQCSKTAKKFMVFWEEEPSSRHHFAVRIQAVADGSYTPAEAGSKNIRPGGSETPCPHCGNRYNVVCPECKLFICYNGTDTTVYCAGCKHKYQLKEEIGDNIDVKTYI